MNETDFARYADSSPHMLWVTIWKMSLSLYKMYHLHFFNGFYDSQMEANPDKFYFICSTDGKFNIIVEDQKIYNSQCKKLLGVRFDSRLTFDAHINAFAKKQALN